MYTLPTLRASVFPLSHACAHVSASSLVELSYSLHLGNYISFHVAIFRIYLLKQTYVKLNALKEIEIVMLIFIRKKEIHFLALPRALGLLDNMVSIVNWLDLVACICWENLPHSDTTKKAKPCKRWVIQLYILRSNSFLFIWCGIRPFIHVPNNNQLVDTTYLPNFAFLWMEI